MSKVHTIRLGSAWAYEDEQRTWVRRFHRPTGIDRARVWLVTTSSTGKSLLNDTPIDWCGDPPRCDITALLRQSNTIRLSEADQEACSTMRLEIEPLESPKVCD